MPFFDSHRRGYWVALVVALSVACVAADYFTGAFILFPITFVVPVFLAAGYLGRWPAVALAVALATARFLLVLMWEHPEFGFAVAGVNAFIRLVVLVGLGVLVDLVARQHRELARRVQTLEGILPICSFCKCIRCEDGKWEPVEVYVTDRSEAKFSHSFCDPCARKHYPECFPAK